MPLANGECPFVAGTAPLPSTLPLSLARPVAGLRRRLSMIALTGLSMHYTMGAARIDVLRGVDLRIAAGQSVAIAGPSGSGKTSLLLLLAGLERSGAGSDGRVSS